jgi:outer membrane lipoprotein-sorting protein
VEFILARKGGDTRMKKAIVAMAVAVTLAFTSGMAMASSCPKLIKQGRDAAATMKADDPKVKGAVAKLDEAQKLHDGGKHKESMEKANEALTELGIKK